MLEAQAIQILQPALGRIGGNMEGKKIVAMAEVHCAQFAPHLFAGPIEAIANIQLSASLPSFLILESIETFRGLYASLLNKSIEWEDVYVSVPNEPGLGFELNEEVADANPYTSDAIFPPLAQVPLWADSLADNPNNANEFGEWT